MSVETHPCDKCGRLCKDRRGLSIHMRVCQGTKDFICEYCNSVFSSVYSLSIHSTRCTEVKKQKQDQDKIVKSEIHQLQDKLKEIEMKHQQEIKNLNVKIRSDYDQQLKIRDDEIKNYYDELNLSKETLKIKEKEVDQLKNTIHEKNVEHSFIKDLCSKLSMKDTTTTIINNDNRVQLQSLDPSMIQGRIDPPGFVVGTVNDLIRMLRSLGVRNCFRVNDKSRGTLSWNKPGEGEIRDPTGDQLLTHIIDSLDSDITKEKCYYEEELKKLYESDERDQYLINEAHEFVSFCTRLLRKDPNILKEIKKQLVKQGRAKNDPQVDEIREISYNKFINSITVAFFPMIYEWNEMTFFELGRYLGKKLKEHYHLEGASREDLYIVVHTDTNNHRQVFSDKLMEHISEAIERVIDNKTLQHLLSEAIRHKSVNKERVEAIVKYIIEPTLQETEEVMRGIVSV